jgi:hypothetical protein
VFRNGYQSHAATETCPGHSTILTGMRPARNGVVANLWADPTAPRADKQVYCAEDEAAPGSTSSKYKVSSVHLRSPTLGDLLKQNSPASRNVAVGGKDRSAVMMSGRSADQRWYPNGTSFATDLPGAAPRSVGLVNEEVKRMLAAPRPPLDAPPLCAGKAQVFEVEGGGKPVGAGRFDRAAGDAAAFRASPEFDAAVLALSAALIQELQLGRDASPDVLSIGLAGTDYVGHSYGTGGQEMCLQLLSLDRDLGDFFGRLDSWGIDYAVALTADHGALDIPERMRARGVAEAARIDAALTPKRVGEQVAKSIGASGSVLMDVGPVGDLYLDPALQGATRTRALQAALAAYRAHPQVEAAFSQEEIARTAMPTGNPVNWTMLQRVRASFDAERSGDIYVALKRNITSIADTTRYVANHGSPWDYDRRVPVILWRSGMTAGAREEPVETIDIMPTLAAMLALKDIPPVDGRCLSGIPGVNCVAR